MLKSEKKINAKCQNNLEKCAKLHSYLSLGWTSEINTNLESFFLLISTPTFQEFKEFISAAIFGEGYFRHCLVNDLRSLNIL